MGTKVVPREANFNARALPDVREGAGFLHLDQENNDDG